MDVSVSGTVILINQQQFQVQLSKTFGYKIYNATTGIHLVSFSDKKPAEVGVFTELVKEGASISVQLYHARQFARTLTFAFCSEFFNDGKHFLNCDCKYSFVKKANGNKLICKQLGLFYRHARGYNVYLSMTDAEKLNSKSFNLLAKANLWSSPDKATTLELSMEAACIIDAPFARKSSFGAGLVLAHQF